MLKRGDPAPEFELPDADLQRVTLADYRDRKNVVLYFYPKDNTTGCTIEAIEFTELIDDFKQHDAVILGVSTDNCVSHANFRDQHGLTVRLLADIEAEVCKLYDVWREKEKNGIKRMGILRSTFLIDKAGTIGHALYDVKPKGHAAEILALIQQMHP